MTPFARDPSRRDVCNRGGVRSVPARVLLDQKPSQNAEAVARKAANP